MTASLADRVDELEAEARRRGIDDSHIHLYDIDATVIAYAELLGFDRAVVFDLSLTLDQIRVASAMVGGSR